MIQFTPDEAFAAGTHFMVIAAWFCLLGEVESACIVAIPAVSLFAQLASIR